MGLYVIGAIVLAVIGFVVWLYTRGKSAGETAISAKVAEKTTDILRDQAKAAADAPHNKTAVIDRLRNGGGL